MKPLNWEKLAQITTVLGFFLIFITVIIGLYQIQEIKKQLSDANEIASLQNVLTLNSQLYTPQNTAILGDIDQKKLILKEDGGSFSDYELDNFISIFDSMDQIYVQKHIAMADLCEQFSYYITTSYEYPEIQAYMKKTWDMSSFSDLYKIVKESKNPNCK
jgi:hypothetical protein